MADKSIDLTIEVVDEMSRKLEKAQDWYFTFGYNHIWPLTGKTLGKNYVVLHGTHEGTREEMNRRFVNNWSCQYESADKAGVDRYKLAEIKLECTEEEYR